MAEPARLKEILPRITALIDEVALDAWLVQDLQPAKLATKPYEPLPVLGIPGWCTANSESTYYEDTTVFRPKRESISPQR